ncbi:uncharacterized protein LOC144634404 [Oculina patagonica]
MDYLSIVGCNIKHIESGTFRAMQNLTDLLSHNMLYDLQMGALDGPADKLINLYLEENELENIADGTFARFSNLNRCYLYKNLLRTVPDLTGPTTPIILRLDSNRIADISQLGKAGTKLVAYSLSLDNNQIDHLPTDLFQSVSVLHILDLSFNKLQSIPDNVFSDLQSLTVMYLSFNNITYINRHTLAGLRSLRLLALIKNNLKYIPKDAFARNPLQSLFLHSNAIQHVDGRAFNELKDLKLLTLFDNPLDFLQDRIFDEISCNAKVSLTCKNLRRLPRGKYASMTIECAPSTTFHILSFGDQVDFTSGLRHSGFVCRTCRPGHLIDTRCSNCSLCAAGFYNNIHGHYGSCLMCPAGGFYQDQMGQVECKRCSIGTFVSEKAHPGTSVSDCLACPYGTLSNETAGYRACRCLQNFYRLDRFGACSVCPAYGFVCENDTAILAPNYFWKWSNQTVKERYKSFGKNIRSFGPQYNREFSVFMNSLPKPIKCPHAGSCKGGIDSECHEGYQGTLCATCTNGYYLRFNACLKCPRLTVTIISSVLVIVLFVAVFLMVLWGDSKHTENDRTIADIIMSCFKIVIGFYQVIAGIFTALARVQWPVALVSMEKYLKLFEGNILQFAPLSCIHSGLRLDHFMKFLGVITLNVLVVCIILLYLLLKKRYIKNKMNRPNSEKLRAVSSLKKSCYRNIFLFLLTSYPTTSKTIIQTLPLPGACVETCFTDDKNHQCISILRADYSIQCFTPRHNIYWPIAAAFAVYPVGFPLMVLFLIYKYRETQEEEEIAFGLKVFFENYKKKFWFWEITEMYRKLILISLVFFFGSESLSQIGFTVATVSAFGVAYTFFRPIKGKFEDRLQTFVLWIIFFDVCLGAVYTNWDVSQGQKENDSIVVNILFVLLNASVLLFALGKGLLHVQSFWKKVSLCPMRCFSCFRRGIALLKNKVVGLFVRLSAPRTDPLDVQEYLIQEYT